MANSRNHESDTVQKSSSSIQNSAVDVCDLLGHDSKQTCLRNIENIEENKSIAGEFEGVQRNVHIYIVESDAHSLGNTFHHTMTEFSSQVS